MFKLGKQEFNEYLLANILTSMYCTTFDLGSDPVYDTTILGHRLNVVDESTDEPITEYNWIRYMGEFWKRAIVEDNPAIPSALVLWFAGEIALQIDNLTEAYVKGFTTVGQNSILSSFFGNKAYIKNHAVFAELPIIFGQSVNVEEDLVIFKKWCDAHKGKEWKNIQKFVEDMFKQLYTYYVSASTFSHEDEGTLWKIFYQTVNDANERHCENAFISNGLHYANSREIHYHNVSSMMNYLFTVMHQHCKDPQIYLDMLKKDLMDTAPTKAGLIKKFFSFEWPDMAKEEDRIAALKFKIHMNKHPDSLKYKHWDTYETPKTWRNINAASQRDLHFNSGESGDPFFDAGGNLPFEI